MTRLTVLRHTLTGTEEAATVTVDPETGAARVSLDDGPYGVEASRLLGAVVGSRRLGRPVSRAEGERYVEAVADDLANASYWGTRVTP